MALLEIVCEVPEGYIPRPLVARRLGVTPQWVIARFDGKDLHPIKAAGRVWYEPTEVRALAELYRRVRRNMPVRTPKRRKIEGDLAARIFQFFDEGVELVEIVETLHVPPADVVILYEHWRFPLETHCVRRRSEAQKIEEAKRLAYEARRAYARSAARAKARRIEEENDALRLELAKRDNELLRIKTGKPPPVFSENEEQEV